MSLHTLAHHLQSAGRGEDKVLVHMTPKEVNGLQALAMAHGGSLTINPQTGLPEAGFLSAILPMVAGFALNAFLPGVGLAVGEALGGIGGAAGTGLLVGGGTALATGSLTKGLMAGMGAYGGAGLGEGLMSAGASELPAGFTPGATAENLGAQGSAFNIPADKLAPSNYGLQPEQALTPGYGVNNSIPGIPGTDVNQMASAYSPQLNATDMITPQVNATPVASDFGQVPSGGADPSLYGQVPPAEAANTGNNIDEIMGKQYGATDKLGAGFKHGTGSWQGAKDVWKAMPTGSGAALGMGLLGAAMEANKPSGYAAAGSGDRGMIRPFSFDYNPTGKDREVVTNSAERRYFNPKFTAGEPYPAAKGGLMSLAVGGQVEEMSAQNSVSGNTMYPQSQLQTNIYSNPMMQRPMPSNVISSGIDAPVDAYTGEERFAEGGATGTGQLDLHVPINLGGAGGDATASGANGYAAAGSGNTGATDSTASTQLVPPAQATQPPAPMAAPQGRQYMPNIQWQSGDIMHGGMSGPLYTSGDPQADAWVKERQNSVLTPGRMDGIGNHKPEIENLYKQYYQGYAKGGVVGLANGGLAHYAFGGNATVKNAEPTSDVKYSFDPKTQQFTQTTTSTPAANNILGNPLIGGVMGLAPYMVAGGMGHPNIGNMGLNGSYMGVPYSKLFGQQAPEPTVTTETSGGITDPYVSQNTAAGLGAASTNFAPNISIPEYQTPEKQLGLEAFYPAMEQKLAERGAQMMGQGYAEGGYTRPAPLNQKMAAVDSSASLMKTQQGLQQVIAAAKKGDYSAMLALQNAGYDMNKLNQFAGGGDVYSLGGYSDGGRLLKGPGDGVSDSIPAVIGNKQPARLADGEFVVPARIVSELGNGSTEAGAKKLYAMMNRVQHARKKSIGKNNVAVNSRAEKLLPA